MQILLLSMPDSFEHTPTLAVRMPNGALSSLAGNVDPHHRVAIADLVLVQSSVRRTVERLIHDLQPDLVGLSVMTFQRVTARRIISLIRSIKPDVRVVVGGYDPSLAPEAWTHPDLGVDFIVRGEGEMTFRELLRALEHRTPLSEVAGLWFREPGGGFRRNPPRPVASVEEGMIRPPNRGARVLSGYTMLGPHHRRRRDVARMHLRLQLLLDHRDARPQLPPLSSRPRHRRHRRCQGAGRARHLLRRRQHHARRRRDSRRLCHAIIDAGFNDVDYLVQGMTAPFAAHGTELAPLMKQAGFRYVFLGIENILEDDLAFLKAGAKNSQRQNGRRIGNATTAAVDILHRHGMVIVGGLIVGNPDDTAEAIEANLAFARSTSTGRTFSIRRRTRARR